MKGKSLNQYGLCPATASWQRDLPLEHHGRGGQGDANRVETATRRRRSRDRRHPTPTQVLGNDPILLANSTGVARGRGFRLLGRPILPRLRLKVLGGNPPTESSLEQKVGLSHADPAFRNQNRQRPVSFGTRPLASARSAPEAATADWDRSRPSDAALRRMCKKHGGLAIIGPTRIDCRPGPRRPGPSADRPTTIGAMS
jgi:hypothetical protein